MKKKNDKRNFFQKYWITILIVAALVLGYHFLTKYQMLDSFVFPTLGAILDSYKENWPTMITNMFASFGLLFPSLIIGTIIAMGLGIYMGLNKRAYEVLYPIVYAISVIPSILLSPIALHVAPSFRAASVFLIVYCTIWPTLFAAITGIETIDRGYMDNAAILELKGLKKMFKVVLPAAMPSILSGFITSLRSAFVILVFAEMYGTQFGMGYFIKKFETHGIYPNVWSGFIQMVVVLVVVVFIFDRIKKRLLRWTM